MYGYRPRMIDSVIKSLMEDFAAVMLVGPRAVGKTTSASRFVRSVVRLDREREAAPFRSDPDAALATFPTPILLDEWQETPAVLGAVKRSVDTDKRPGRFLLTGSVRADMESRTWPGVGRVVRADMYPLTVAEHLGRPTSPLIDRLVEKTPLIPAPESFDLSDYVTLALQGGFPDAVFGSSDNRQRIWLDNYAREIVTADLAANGRRDNRKLFEYLTAYALYSAKVSQDKSVYDKAGISKKTASRYESLLSNAYIVSKLHAWSTNRLSRLVRSPKRYLVDTGLWASLLDATLQSVFSDGDLMGSLLDTWVTSQLRAQAQVSAHRYRLHHLRTAQGRHEIDLIVDIAGHGVVAVEVKATGAPSQRDIRHLVWLRNELGDLFIAGVVLNSGPHVHTMSDRITAAPFSTLWCGH